MLYVEAQAVVDAHVLVCHPHEGKERNDVTSPVWKKQLETGDQQYRSGNVVAEAIFTGEKVEKLAASNISTASAFPLAVLTRFAENLFVSNRPGNAGDGNSQRQ